MDEEVIWKKNINIFTHEPFQDIIVSRIHQITILDHLLKLIATETMFIDMIIWARTTSTNLGVYDKSMIVALS